MWKSYVALLTYLACCVILGLLIALLSSDRCTSKVCLRKARLIVQNMDASVGRCDNFYTHICGNYIGLHRKNAVLLDRGSLWEDIKQVQIRRLVTFLDKPPAKREDRVLRLLKMVYKTCHYKTGIEAQGYTPLRRHMQQAGGFPLIEGSRWDNKPFGDVWSVDAVEYSTHYAGFVGGHLFKSYIDRVEETVDEYFVHLSPPAIEPINSSHFDAYFTYVEKISSILNTTKEDRSEEIKDTLNFINKLASIVEKVSNCSLSHQREELTKFSSEFKFLNLDLYLKNMLPYIHLPKHLMVTYVSRDYFTNLDKLINDTPKRIIANYLMIENIIEVTAFLPKPLREAYVELLNATKDPGSKYESTKKGLCAKAVKSKMSSALSALYLRDKFKEYRQPGVLYPTINTIKEEMKNMVQDLKWMDKTTKRKAVTKIEAMNFSSPVSEDVFHNLTNVTAFRIYYEDLCFTGNTSTILSAYLTLEQYKTHRNWELLERPNTVFDDNIDIFSAEITFDHRRNAVNIPMGFLRYPSFEKGWPFYLNYGGFSSEIAKQLVHGIDLSGSQYSPKGKRVNWWSLETKGEYKKYARCFVNKYNDYLKEMKTIKLEDPACIQNNIAENAGVKIAYKAYINYQQQRFFSERRMPKLTKYSPNQMFFIDFTTFHCKRNKTVYHENITELEVSQTSPEYKVLGSLQGYQQFSKDFGCGSEQRMNPSARCDMWGE